MNEIRMSVSRFLPLTSRRKRWRYCTCSISIAQYRYQCLVNTAETSYQPENSNKAISRHVEGQISGHFCSERAVSTFKPALRMGTQNGSASALIGEQVVVRFWVGRHWITAGRVVQSKKCLRDSGAAGLARVTHPEDSSCVAETPFLFSTFTVLLYCAWPEPVLANDRSSSENGAKQGRFRTDACVVACCGDVDRATCN